VESLVHYLELERQNLHLLNELETANDRLSKLNYWLEEKFEERGAHLFQRMADLVVAENNARRSSLVDPASKFLTASPWLERVLVELGTVERGTVAILLIAMTSIAPCTMTELTESCDRVSCAIQQTLQSTVFLRPPIVGRIDLTRFALAVSQPALPLE